MSARLVLLVGLAACSSRDPDVTSSSTARDEVPTISRADAPAFGLYVLALTWAPNFCCSHPDKEECAGLATAFAGSHLTLHGLWPNFTDEESHGHTTYPQFCGSYAHCRDRFDERCAPDPATVPRDMRELGPGYIADRNFLANHEWPKHGSCTGLDPAAYFNAALAAMKRLPHDGTPDVLARAIGGEIARDELAGSFGVPAASVLLSCDAHCQLSQVSICLAHDANNLPTTPIACPTNTTDARYDNGCVVRRCDRVVVPAAGQCSVSRNRGDDSRPHRTRGDRPATHACNRPGQGPSCDSDADCTSAGYARCARSGCCTSQP